MVTKEDMIAFFKVQASPFFWREKAEQLKFAAEILWPHAKSRYDIIIKSVKEKKELNLKILVPDTFSIFLSLLGFSTEALLKGVIIRDNPSYVSNGILSSKLTIHDLIALSKIAQLPLSKNEKIFCKQAYKAMMVESRYPIPKGIEKPNYALEIGGHCKEVFTGLYERLYPTLGQFN